MSRNTLSFTTIGVAFSPLNLTVLVVLSFLIVANTSSPFTLAVRVPLVACNVSFAPKFRITFDPSFWLNKYNSP